MLVYGALTFLAFVEIAFAGENIPLNRKKCVPTATVQGPCHVCICTTEGVYHCRGIPCRGDIHNVTDARSIALPEIRDGEACIPGRMYKNECNTCKCTADFTLICTKMACIDWKRLGFMQDGKKVLRKVLRSGTQKKSKSLPTVPVGPCKPGKIYKAGCRKCFCTDKGKVICSQKEDACTFDKNGLPTPIENPEDVRPPIDESLRNAIATLPSASSKCEPGKTYKVDCNNCVCLENSNLLCDMMLCLSYDDTHRLKAKDMSGKSCKTGDLTTDHCVKCDCVKGLTECVEQLNCVAKDARQTLSYGGKVKLKIDAVKDACVANAVYNSDCNKCYCQADGTLRCTAKTCLNYSQVKMLEKQREYLEKHGL